MGALVALPQARLGREFLGLSAEMLAWLDTHVGTRGEDWGASFTWSCQCWHVMFKDPKLAVLFKLTWLGIDSYA